MTKPAIELASDSNHDAGTVYYPTNGSVTGQALESTFFSIGITAEDCTVEVQVSADRSNWIGAHQIFEDVQDRFWGAWMGDDYTFAAGATETHLWHAWFLAAEWVRLKVTYPNSTNSIAASLLPRSL